MARIIPKMIPTTIAAVPVNNTSKNPMIIIVIQAYNNFLSILEMILFESGIQINN